MSFAPNSASRQCCGCLHVLTRVEVGLATAKTDSQAREVIFDSETQACRWTGAYIVRPVWSMNASALRFVMLLVPTYTCGRAAK